jgi:hypothetical protein
MNGLVLKDKSVHIWYFDDTTNVHYTLDGTMPTRRSVRVQPELTLMGGGKITYTRNGAGIIKPPAVISQ